MSDYLLDKEFHKELIVKFIQESREFIEIIEESLLNFSDKSGHKKELTTAFRNFHSLKGNAGMLGFSNLEKISHFSETILEQLKENIDEFHNSNDIISDILKILDLISEGVESIATSGNDTIADIENILKKITPKFINYGFSLENTVTKQNKIKLITPIKKDNSQSDFISYIKKAIDEISYLLSNYFLQEISIFPKDKIIKLFEILKKYALIDNYKALAVYSEFYLKLLHKETPETIENNQTLQFVIEDLFDLIKGVSDDKNADINTVKAIVDSLNNEVNLELDVDLFLANSKLNKKPILEKVEPYKNTESPKVNAKSINKTIKNESEKNIKEIKVNDSNKNKSSKEQNDSPTKKREIIRVDLHKLDNLLDLVGELVIAGSTVMSHGKSFIKNDNFNNDSESLGRIIREIQELCIDIRLVPIGGVFNKMRRLVHDLSNKSGKKLNLSIFGETTEIDKSVSEMISDPLVHIIRNAVDHGIETIEERVAKGKKETGNIILRASHLSGEIRIIIKDDGHGLDHIKIFNAAVKKGFINGNIEDYSKEQIFNLIFKAGFSTSKKITNISGRGVGMDVVKKNIEKLKGTIEINSTLGKGTTLLIKLPLTLAIMEGLLVKCGTSKYIIPLLAIYQTFVATEEMITTTHDGTNLVQTLDKLYAIYKLSKLHNIKPKYEDITKGILILVNTEKERIALLVDEIIGQESIVIKGLSEYIGNIKGVSGYSVLGDGGICLILDVNSLFKNSEKKRNQ